MICLRHAHPGLGSIFAIAIATIMGAWAIHAGGGQPAQPPVSGALGGESAEPTWLRVVIPDLDDRLEALSPADPRAYFTMGEEVAAQAITPEEVVLARTLHVLAFELDRRRQAAGAIADPGLGASVCLALADLSRHEEDRRWLVSMARSLDRRYASPDWSRAAQPSYSGQAGFRAAEFLGLVRSGDGIQAREALRREDVLYVLEDYERMLGGIGSSGALRGVMIQARQWPCPQCSNARIARLGETIPPRRGLCPTCRGNPGPTLSRDDYVEQLRFESGLLEGIQTSWGAQLSLDLGAPLREPESSELAPTMGVDPEKPYFRGGQWVRTPVERARGSSATP